MSDDDERRRNQLERFLQTLTPGTDVAVDSYERIGGGYSRIMARARAVVDGEVQWLVTRSDPPAGQAAVETDRDAEWQLWSWLTRQNAVFIPAALHYDSDGSAMGSKTIVLEMVHGQPLLSIAKQTDQDSRLALADRLCDLAARIHSTDLGTFPTALARPASWDDYFDSRLDLWRGFAETHQDPFAFHVLNWLRRNRPREAPLTLVHGEFQSTNVMVENGSERLFAIDWEFGRVGDPREDLAWAAWVEAIQPPALVTLDLPRFCRRYAERTGLGGDLVDPTTLAYFGVLTGIQIAELAFPALRAFQTGQNRSIVTAYTFGMAATLHEAWMAATTRHLDA